MRKKVLYTCFLIAIVGLVGCQNQENDIASQAGDTTIAQTSRWYTNEQVLRGKEIYNQYCIGCHLVDAQGTTEWKKTLDDGSYPPPPLNGSAHAWHHSLDVLMSVIDSGGVPLGGKMPAFGNVLTQSEKLSVIAYFQSFWNEEIYTRWKQINER
jgi:mono/diheme cytochrome c family protein